MTLCKEHEVELLCKSTCCVIFLWLYVHLKNATICEHPWIAARFVRSLSHTILTRSSWNLVTMRKDIISHPIQDNQVNCPSHTWIVFQISNVHSQSPTVFVRVHIALHMSVGKVWLSPFCFEHTKSAEQNTCDQGGIQTSLVHAYKWKWTIKMHIAGFIIDWIHLYLYRV